MYGGWVGWKIFNARKTGERLVGWKAYVPFASSGGSSSTNYPTPRSANPLEWIKDQFSNFRNGNNRSTTRAGYEDTRGAEGQYANLNPESSGTRGRGRGLEDDAWDTRVGNEDPYGQGPGGYHEEAELGLAPTPNIGTGSHQPYVTDYMEANTSYGGGLGHSRGGSDLNPFEDHAEASSLRSVSPRPSVPAIDTRTAKGHLRSVTDDGNTSPISTRKSVFREDMS